MEVHLALVPGPQYPDFAQNLGDSLRQFLLDVGVRFHTKCHSLSRDSRVSSSVGTPSFPVTAECR